MAVTFCLRCEGIMISILSTCSPGGSRRRNRRTPMTGAPNAWLTYDVLHTHTHYIHMGTYYYTHTHTHTARTTR